ncbi:erythromycin esterase family protein [Flavobacterium sp. HSC-61S13]|uniref:erythromycin esterase family protein n=1 Tax=Flavobacterium sp. HSC-61S13 TaxID=2910963 RepID=UPI0020A16980|nr:erythromycin esterase family protein [Flavobacterium sp. HSC-61S13]MCP1994324.1 erythromycin esterase [Flavobacterium sp. HSC-61S13]
MQKIISIIALIIPVLFYSQNKETINWISDNSITIEDANPDSELNIFNSNTPIKFENAKIYGFGEASHNTKEFFDLKAKFFKYLVKNKGLKVFIMEESYQAEEGINEWIKGGQGDKKTIANNFNIGFWKTKEITDLLEWMRNYNIGKAEEEQIKFYGMDTQLGHKINLEIRDFVLLHKIKIDESLLIVADSCSNKKIDYEKPSDWWQLQVPKLNQLKQQILHSNLDKQKYQTIERSLNYLISYAEYATSIKEKYPTSVEFRDLKMFENVKYIVDQQAKGEKVFIWAHNEHINKKEMYYTGSGILTLGRHLKDYYKDDYYSIGFDFGTGKINGYVIDKKKGNYWKTYHITKPFPKTYANMLMSINKNIFFIDMEDSYLNEPTHFFSKKSSHLMIGGGGYQPKPLHRILINKIYYQAYDGLIFVKEISPPNLNL